MNKMNKDWDRPKNVVSPIWNNGYGRYDLSIDEVIQKIKDSGYNLEEIDAISKKFKELEIIIENLIDRIQELENKLL